MYGQWHQVFLISYRCSQDSCHWHGTKQTADRYHYPPGNQATRVKICSRERLLLFLALFLAGKIFRRYKRTWREICSQEHLTENYHLTNRGSGKNFLSSSTPPLYQQPWSVLMHQLWLPLQKLMAHSIMTWALPLAGYQRKNPSLSLATAMPELEPTTLHGLPACAILKLRKWMKMDNTCWNPAATMVSVSATPSLISRLSTRSPGTSWTWFCPGAPVYCM